MKLLAIVLLITLTPAIALHAQSETKLLKKARKELSLGDYKGAKRTYNELLTVNSTDPAYQFETGLAYYNSGVNVEKSIPYFEKALELSKQDTIAEVLYYLGRSYQYVERFEDAIDYYNHFKDYIKNNSDGVILSRDVNRYIQMCNNGINYKQNKDEDLVITNFDRHVNSEGSEYAPVMNKEKSMMLFTGRRKGSTGGKFYHDNKHYEDIYVTRYENNEWTNSNLFDSSNVYVSKEINSKYHDAAIAFNEFEDKLFIYRKNHIWVSEKKDGKWTPPVKMNSNVNSKTHDPSVFITRDEQTLLIVSTDREGGFGGRDIWMSKKNSRDEWGEAVNLGEVINTEFDEDAPFLTEDGKTLYFSSNGHTTMGGYDVFKSELQADSTWSEPVNLGAPINSPADDIYYIQDDEGLMAYYSSSRMGGYGDMDIYMIQLECKSIPKTEIKGILVAGSKQFPVGGKITIKDENGDVVETYSADPKTGKYLMILEPEKSYTMEVKAKDPWYIVRPHKETFTLPKQCDPFPLYQEVAITRLQNENGQEYAQEALFQNAFFNYQDTVKAHYNIAGDPSSIDQMVGDSLQFNLAGELKFNEALRVDQGARVYLLNSDNEIVRISETNHDGSFNFRSLNPEEDYMVAFDETDLKYIYYGTNSTNSENGIVVLGNIQRVYKNEIKESEPVDSIKVLLFNAEKKVTNIALTNENGSFSIDNLPNNLEPIEALNENEFVYNMDNKEFDFAVSAFVNTIDPIDNSIHYSEYIDIIDIPIQDGGDSVPPVVDGIAFENIYFDFDKYFLRDKSKSVLDKIYDYMAAHPGVTIRMDGHTDWFGTDQYNVVLSENRAKSAEAYLSDKGIEKQRINLEWFGESRPAVPNANPDGTDNPENRQLNRRVEFKIKTKDMAFILSH